VLHFLPQNTKGAAVIKLSRGPKQFTGLDGLWLSVAYDPGYQIEKGQTDFRFIGFISVMLHVK
jgi:hypothetical protein